MANTFTPKTYSKCFYVFKKSRPMPFHILKIVANAFTPEIMVSAFTSENLG